jgi:hypothetical protein
VRFEEEPPKINIDNLSNPELGSIQTTPVNNFKDVVGPHLAVIRA